MHDSDPGDVLLGIPDESEIMFARNLSQHVQFVHDWCKHLGILQTLYDLDILLSEDHGVTFHNVDGLPNPSTFYNYILVRPKQEIKSPVRVNILFNIFEINKTSPLKTAKDRGTQDSSFVK